MATVKKCDICGAIHDCYPDAMEKHMGISVMTRNSNYTGHIYGEDEFDLCPECTEKVLSFIDVLKTYPTRYCINILSEEE